MKTIPHLIIVSSALSTLYVLLAWKFTTIKMRMKTGE